jgi:site-specific DNA-methyltransferase (adenine-specific)
MSKDNDFIVIADMLADKYQHFRSGNTLLLNADCMDVMALLPDGFADLAIVDPPYGIKRDKGFEGFGGFGGFGKPIKRKKYDGNWDNGTPCHNYFTELLRVSLNSIVWGGNFFTDKLPQANHWVFWDKINTMPTFGDGELAWTSFNRNSVKQCTIEYNGLLGKEIDRIHATQKPKKLYSWLLANYSKSDQIIIDTHGGSFSSAIASHYFGARFIGVEKDLLYFNSAIERFKRETAQVDLLQEFA